MNAPFHPRLPRCPCCSRPIYEWRHGAWIEPCRRCERPLVLVKSAMDWNGPRRLRNLFDLVSAGYGIATVVLVAVFALTNLGPVGFSRAFAVLLFVIGPLLIVDGVLSLRTKIDRTWGRLRQGAAASAIAVGKVVSGSIALAMVWIGLTL